MTSATMSKLFVVLVAILASSSAGRQKLSLVAATHSKNHIPVVEFEGKKHSSGAELTSLAHSSAFQATTAVRNQQSASLQASAGTQSGYARAASEAAYAAKVALIAKQTIAQNLQESIAELERYLQDEEAQYLQSLDAANRAQNTVEGSQRQLAALAAAYAAGQQTVTQNEQAAATAAQAAGAQQQMIQDAQQRLARLHARLNDVLAGLQETQLAAQKAAAAAHAAQNNAAGAAQLAVVSIAENQLKGRGHGYHF